MNWANYLIQINLYLTLFYAFYMLFLRNETFFNLNRTYLLSAAFFSISIPLIRTEWVKSLFFTEKVQQNWSSVNVMVMEGFSTPIKEEFSWALGDYLTFVYLFTMLFLVFRLIYRLTRVQKMLNSDNHPEAFSFFRKVRVNADLPQKEQIEKHEQTHAKQLHTADVLFFEVLSIINWFNPITYLYKKSIRQIHEFIADEQALHLQSNKKDYALLLFSKSFGINPNSLTNNFFNQSLLKRRIMMLQKPKSRKTAILKYGLSAPLFLIAMVLSSATISENKTIKQIENQLQPAQPIAEILVPKVVENMVINEGKPIAEVVNEQLINSTKIDVDFSNLKSHLSKTLKYPLNARSNGIVGKVGIEISINSNGLITNSKTINSPNEELKNEAIRALSSFSEKLNAEAGTYSIILNFIMIGEKNETKIDNETNFGVLKNYVGEIVISAYDYALKEVKVVGYESKNEEAVLTNVDILPGFPGGLSAFGKFLAENLKYPEIARKNQIQGRVFLSFVVEKDGSLSGIKIARGIGGGCDEEAVRVLSISPKWTPGIQNGQIVRVSYTVPIFFQLDNKVNGINTGPTTPRKILSPESEQDLKSNLDVVINTSSLIIIDGEEIDRNGKSIGEFVKAADIESVNVLKGEEAIKAYGDKGKNGVIVITKKKK